MVRGLSNADGAAIVQARGETGFASVDDLWRRSRIASAGLVRLAEADAFKASLNLSRREALWAIRALRDEPLPLFEAARSSAEATEIEEPATVLKPMTEGREVIEDYGHVGLTLRAHPLAFLRRDLSKEGYLPCAEATGLKDASACTLAGLVLVRQKPGSAKGVMFITLEDETGVANLVIWPSLYEQQRKVILTAPLLGVRGRIQREGETVHVVAYRLIDLSAALASVGGRGAGLLLPHGRGDEFHRGPPPADPREPARQGLGARDIYIPDLHMDTLKLKTRDFR
jgi:error-prone DNA polymerase